MTAPAPLPSAIDELACRHCTQEPCVCPALPCAGFLGPCPNPKKGFTTLRNDKGEAECPVCFARRRKARCWK